MTSRFVRPCLPLLMFVLALSVRAQSPAPPPLPTNPAARPPASQPAAAPAPAAATPAPADDPMVTVKLPAADLDTILDALELYTGKTILRPAALPTTTYNLNLKQPIPRSAAIRYLETVLQMNSIGVAPLDEHAMKVVALNMVRTEAPEFITGSTLDLPPSGRTATKFFQPEFVRVAEIQPMLQQILNPVMGGMQVLPNSNALFITDSISNLQRVELLLQEVDHPTMGGIQPKFYGPLHNAKASDVVNKLRGIITGPLQLQLGQATTYSADDRTNQIVVVTDPRQYPFFDELIAKLDMPGEANTRNEVIGLKHAAAKDVSTTLTQLVQGQTSAAQRTNTGSIRPGQIPLTPTQPNPAPATPNGAPTPAALNTPGVDTLLGSSANEFSSLVTIIPDERSNSIVVSGTVDDIRLIKQLVEQLDTILAQVRIEVVIAEVSLDDNDTSGIGALGLKLDGDKLVGFSATAGDFSGIDVANGVITRPGTSGPWDLAAEISLGTTPRKNDTTLLSVPAITTTHAQEATVISSEQRPIISGSQQTITGGTTVPVTSSTITQQDIGITLKVKPLIGSDGSVQLKVTTDVKDVAGFVTIDSNQQPIISHRSTDTFITAHDGDIIVLGGLQRQSVNKTTSRLGPIPIIGDLLGARTHKKSRTELIFFLRPHILTNTPADNESTLNRINELPEPAKGNIHHTINPNFVPPKPSIIDKILPH